MIYELGQSQNSIKGGKRKEERGKGVLEDWLLSLMSTLVMGFGPEY
jgi:hypothetical protein